MTLYAVTHAHCGHPAAVSRDRARMEYRRDLLHAAGQRQWRVRVYTGPLPIPGASTVPGAEHCTTCGTGAGDTEHAAAEPEQPSPLSPDCKAGKCSACVGDAWDTAKDAPANCRCDCHRSTR
jgi:hypothetical protein